MSLIQESLEGLNVRCKSAPRDDVPDSVLKLRVGGFDRRKVVFKGWVDVEKFSYRGTEGSFCVMQRDVVRILFCDSVYSAKNFLAEFSHQPNLG